MRLFIVLLFSFLLMGCFESVRQSIGISSKPFSDKQGFEESTKVNYKIIWGQIRSKKSEEDDD